MPCFQRRCNKIIYLTNKEFDPSENLKFIFLHLIPLFCLPGQGHGRGRGRGHGRPGLNPKSPNHQKAAGPPNQAPGGRRIRSELKTKDQILKQRRKQQKQQFLQGGGMKKLRTKNKRFLSDMKKSGFGRGGQKKGKMRKRL